MKIYCKRNVSDLALPPCLTASFPSGLSSSSCTKTMCSGRTENLLAEKQRSTTTIIREIKSMDVWLWYTPTFSSIVNVKCMFISSHVRQMSLTCLRHTHAVDIHEQFWLEQHEMCVLINWNDDLSWHVSVWFPLIRHSQTLCQSCHHGHANAVPWAVHTRVTEPYHLKTLQTHITSSLSTKALFRSAWS